MSVCSRVGARSSNPRNPAYLQAMLNPEWRLRPTAESVLRHSWLNGTSMEALQQSPRATGT